ncbi:MAG: potassium channel family protein [Candidatus Bilamarchaeaceae archaeon]
MDEVARKILFAVGLVVFFYFIGIFIYAALEGWGWVDSIYFMTQTFTTVGYGDITPSHDLSKLFTVIFMWSGISAGFYLIYAISEYRQKKIDAHLMKLLEDESAAKEKGGKFRPTVFSKQREDGFLGEGGFLPSKKR